MAELSLRERLQPALLDRLIDDERLLTIYEFSLRADEMQRYGFVERDIVEAVRGQGLRLEGSGDGAALRFTAATGRASLAQIKGLALTNKSPQSPGGWERPLAADGQPVTLQTLCDVVVRNIPNRTIESIERRSITPRKLREYVCRDLATLLNSASLDHTLDLTRYPHVRDSVLNFGMTSMAGRAAYSVEPQKIAASIEDVIRRFEPRLSQVRVTSESSNDSSDTHVLSFRIEAELWGQPVPQHLVLRTSIEMHSGDVSVADTVGK